jgi:TolB-like protein/DNA-binding winged helix-turn-helix (wHTH) protein
MAITVFEFAEFKLDCDRFELCRAGRSLKLERKPMELLILLAVSHGRLVTRAEIAERLWDSEVFVDTEHGINTAIRKIRVALHDNPEQPRFLQTVPGKGYRFIAPLVEASPPLREDSSPEDASLEDSTASIGDRPREPRAPSEPKARSSPRRSVWLPTLRAAAVPALLVVVAAISLGVLGWGNRFPGRAAKPQIKSLAVLPLDNLSGDPAQDYFADGMTDELITMLAKNSTLRITSRTSVMQYKRAQRPLREIAQELGVDAVLEGSVVRTGDKVHMTIQLIQAPSDTHLWAESYDRNANDVVSLPSEAAQTIARRLSSVAPLPTTARFVRPEAHDAYLRGRYLWFMDHNDEAGKYFQRATELQPDYALGWSGLANYYGAGTVDGILAPEDALPKEEAAAVKAVELDDSLAEAHLSLGAAIFFHQWDWKRADQEITRAIELNPSFAEAYHFRAKMRAALNRHQEAIEAEKKAAELDPFERPFAMALAYFLARQYDAAISDARLRLETLPDDPDLHWALWEAYRRKGQPREAAQELEKYQALTGNKAAATNIRLAFEQGGDPSVLRWRISDLTRQSSKHYVSPVELAVLYAQLGRREETLSLLEEAMRQHSPFLLWIQNDPAFDFLHSDERYRSLIRRIGLPPAY